MTQVIARRMADEAVLVLTGPRTVGKSTLLHAVAASAEREVIDLDDLGVRSAGAADPALFASGGAPVLIDEYQKVPELLDAIKAELGGGLTPGRYVLAGSTRYETLPQAAQSLTGRAHVMTVWPLSQGEIHGVVETFVEQLLKDPRQLVNPSASRTSREDYIARVVAGGLPIAVQRQGAARTRWFADYVNLVCERDVLEISRVRQRALLPRLLTRLAGQTASLLNIAQAARTLNMEARTAESYTKLLEAVFLIHRLPAWGTTVGSKAGATAKIHVIDSGLAAHLLRLSEAKLSNRTPAALAEFGHLLETFVVNELLKQVSWLEDVVTAGHWRTRDGAEVDLVLERSDGGVAGVEVKAGSRVQGPDVRHLAALADRLGDAWLGGAVLHTGNRAFTIDEQRGIHVLPLDRLWT
jgi:predicted AAA+ superfamily ATPase